MYPGLTLTLLYPEPTLTLLCSNLKIMVEWIVSQAIHYLALVTLNMSTVNDDSCLPL